VECVAISDHTRLATFGNLPPEEVIFGSSPAMMNIRRSIERAADTRLPVLFQGETGTGKEVLARFIHHRSSWGAEPFIKINCPAVPGHLFESELFGHEKGAFTGAFGAKPGRVELARCGTLFLDEIGDLDLNLQAKLLQLLQDGHFCRVGGQTEKHAEARIVCATNRPLQRAVKAGTFREDVFYRISVLSAELPPLRARNGDIPMLVGYFLEKYRRAYGRVVTSFSNSLLGRLQEHSWPGNIRQLENVVHRYVLFESEQAITDSLEQGDNGDADHLSLEQVLDASTGLKELTQKAVRHIERRAILLALEANGWHRGLAARALGISYGALLYKIKEAGLPLKRSKKPIVGSQVVPLNSTERQGARSCGAGRSSSHRACGAPISAAIKRSY
jgi:two-component system response regulator AtoC